jgi:hypothetical protein
MVLIPVNVLILRLVSAFLVYFVIFLECKKGYELDFKYKNSNCFINPPTLLSYSSKNLKKRYIRFILIVQEKEQERALFTKKMQGE